MELRTARLLLRELSDEDWAGLHACESDPEVVRFQSYEIFTPERSRQYIEDAKRDRLIEPRQCYDFGVALSGTFIGRTGMRLGVDQDAMIWFSFQRQHWGSGYATEATRALCNFAFGQLGLHRLLGDCDPRNRGSIGVLERLGMRREAHYLENVFLKGAWCDSMIYAVLAREWRLKASG